MDAFGKKENTIHQDLGVSYKQINEEKHVDLAFFFKEFPVSGQCFVTSVTNVSFNNSIRCVNVMRKKRKETHFRDLKVII